MFFHCVSGIFLCYEETCFLGEVLLADAIFVLKGKSDLKNITKLCFFSCKVLVTANLGSLTWES